MLSGGPGSTGAAGVVMTYTFPKNHDVQTLVFTLMGSGSYTAGPSHHGYSPCQINGSPMVPETT